MGSIYATRTDLYANGLPITAKGPVTDAQIDATLVAASAFIDSKLRGRYPLPLLAWGTEITEACCALSAEKVLTIRGWNPLNPGEAAIVKRADDVRTWLDQVQRSAAHPDVTTSSAGAVAYQSPKVLSSSVIATGCSATGATRGW